MSVKSYYHNKDLICIRQCVLSDINSFVLGEALKTNRSNKVCPMVEPGALPVYHKAPHTQLPP